MLNVTETATGRTYYVGCSVKLALTMFNALWKAGKPAVIVADRPGLFSK